jgi:hypothetical protein
MASGQQVKDNGWRQGSFLPSIMALALAAEHECEDATHAVIISQDCDVTHGDLEIEPFVDILFLCTLDAINPGLQDGKSSRMLHLEALEGTGKRFFKTQPWNQARVRRGVLATSSPDSTLSINTGTLQGMIQWIADRYTRTGFPDEFVNRIEAIDESLKKLMKKEGSAFWRILVHLNSNEELDANTDYGMDCVCAVWPEVWEDTKRREKAAAAASKLKKLLEGCSGIALDEFEINSTDEIPLSYLHQYRSWDVFNYLTHRDLLKEKGQEP